MNTYIYLSSDTGSKAIQWAKKAFSPENADKTDFSYVKCEFRPSHQT